MSIGFCSSRLHQDRSVVCLGAVAVLFLLGALAEIRTPGIYMDAVNNDYLVARLFSPIRSEIAAWVHPGSLLFDRFPIVSNTYVGSLSFFVGLPAYTLLGTSIEAIRAVNAMYALIVLFSAWWFLVRFGAGHVIATFATSIIALDPAFVSCFRTQFNINVLPVAFLLFGLVVAEPLPKHQSIKRAMAAGFLSGLALYGYFVFFFAAVVSFVYVLVVTRALPRQRKLLAGWIVGAAIALSPFLIFLISLTIAVGGPAQAFAYLKGNWQALGPASSSLGLVDRFYWYWFLVGEMIDSGAVGMMVRPLPPLVGLEMRDWLALALTGMGIVCSLKLRTRMQGTLLALAALLSFLPVILLFGDRLFVHHVAPSGVLFAIALGFGLASLAQQLIVHWRIPRVVALAFIAVLISPILVTNALNRQAMLLSLRATGGVGLASDAILNFAEDSLHDSRSKTVVLPDWGIFMSFEMVTRGTIPTFTDFSPDLVLQALCQGRDVVLAIMVVEGEERVAKWVREVGWTNPDLRYFDQRDGTHIVLSARLRADQKPSGAACR